MRRILRDNGLGLFFGGIFLMTLIGQALVGHADFNHQQLSHQDDPVSLARYLFSSSFGSDVMENWQSEFLARRPRFGGLSRIYLRQGARPNRRPVGAPHGGTGVEAEFALRRARLGRVRRHGHPATSLSRHRWPRAAFAHDAGARQSSFAQHGFDLNRRRRGRARRHRRRSCSRSAARVECRVRVALAAPDGVEGSCGGGSRETGRRELETAAP
jgi:hypothetical protein